MEFGSIVCGKGEMLKKKKAQRFIAWMTRWFQLTETDDSGGGTRGKTLIMFIR